MLSDGELIHVDIAWEEARLGLEPGHTFWHSGNEKVRSDHGRDRACDEIGWRILRFDEIELREMRRCVRQVVNIYRQRAR
jgi:very-short-patch-repair endonuclease